MIAGIYARKSTDQTGVSDEQKSVARQIEHARLCASRKGWMVDDLVISLVVGPAGARTATEAGARYGDAVHHQLSMEH
jgi:hypothetical protein